MRRFDFKIDAMASCHCDMEESDDGDYVRYEDVIESLEDLRRQVRERDNQIDEIFEEMAGESI